MSQDIATMIEERAVLAAWRTAWAEYQVGPGWSPEDAAYTWVTANATAHHELSEAFPEPVAKLLAHAIARAVRAHFCPEHGSEDE